MAQYSANVITSPQTLHSEHGIGWNDQLSNTISYNRMYMLMCFFLYYQVFFLDA